MKGREVAQGSGKLRKGALKAKEAQKNVQMEGKAREKEARQVMHKDHVFKTTCQTLSGQLNTPPS